MAKTLIKNGIIITLGKNNRVLYNHGLLIEEDKIVSIAPITEFTDTYDLVIDAKNQVVMPGFINGHMHFYSTMVRGLGKAEPANDFLGVLENLWWRLDKKLTLEDTYYSTLLMLLTAIKKGTTTIIDHHASPFAILGSLQEIAKAVKQTGLRANLCYELSDRDGEKTIQEGIQENADFIRYCQENPSEQIKALFGLHASFTLSDQTLRKAAKIGHDLNTGFHVHTAEADSDQQYNIKHFGKRVVERFYHEGILGPNTICAHCTHINDAEIELLRKTNTIAVHNPQSNMNNAVGVANIMKMINAGVLVGLGTDAMTVNMLEELRCALWAQHLSQKNPTIAFMEVTQTLLFNNAEIANRFWNVGLGELKAGNAADLVLIDYMPITPLDETTVLGHILFGLSQATVDTTIANGNTLMRNKQLQLGINEEEVSARCCELAKALWQRF